jgi:hypothetical protein
MTTGRTRVVVRAFLPDAERIGVADPATDRVVRMLARVHRERVFEGRLCSSRSGLMQQRSNETVFMSTTRGF